MSARITYNGPQAEAVPVVRQVKCTNVRRNSKIENARALLLLAVISRTLFTF